MCVCVCVCVCVYVHVHVHCMIVCVCTIYMYYVHTHYPSASPPADDQVCGHFQQSLQQVADIITTSVYQVQEIGFILVKTDSLDDVREYGVRHFTGLYLLVGIFLKGRGGGKMSSKFS